MPARKLNSMITNKAKCLELIDALTELEIIIQDRNKINDNKILEIEETEKIIENVLKEFKEDKEDELENKLRFLAAKNLFLERSDNIEKETKTERKNMKEIEAFKTKMIGIKELMIGTINYYCNRLLTDLDFKEKSVVKVLKLIETKLKRQNVSKRIIDTIKRLLFNSASNECYCLYDLYLD